MGLTRRNALIVGIGALTTAGTASYGAAQTESTDEPFELLAEENIDHEHACLHAEYDERTSLEAGESVDDAPTVDDTHVIWEVTDGSDQGYVVFDADGHHYDGPFVFYTTNGTVSPVTGTEVEDGTVDDDSCGPLDAYVVIEPDGGRIELELSTAESSESDTEPAPEDDESEADDEDESAEDDENASDDEPDEPDEDDEDEAEADDGDDDEDADDEPDEEDDESVDDDEDADDEPDAEDDDDDTESVNDETEGDEQDEDESVDDDPTLELSVSAPESITTEDSARFTLTVRNEGDVDADLTVELEVDGDVHSVSIGLNAGECDSSTLCVSGSSVGRGDHDWTVTAADETATGALSVTAATE
ncbi:hypothetical protein [Natronorubrum daqingense]|uniref:Uncharacterized protein n=1 Tax=Natronorubrum daqingense TaxID=588898 RepID=A0A1N7A9W9_9EURY|nr:hypothetical protein [Natronorubrum daqingense]APX98063.1 hypothetical protein BB347_16375 [Natronorubrum daqingense]SIR35781.1 hypothetical protein SAMN05421809_1085 [Natronorubrum daqingense]